MSHGKHPGAGKREWTRLEREENRKKGLCRCGGVRVEGKASCQLCLGYEVKRRRRAAKAGKCSWCRDQSASPGFRTCKTCRDNQAYVRHEAMRLYRESLK